MDDVRVHYNSSRPAQVHARAYTQGTDIHLGPGEEEHLPHEAWHVVQQKQGRVRPTLQAKGLPINDDAGLEREADVMGARAAITPVAQRKEISASYSAQSNPSFIPFWPTANVIQRQTMEVVLNDSLKKWSKDDWEEAGWKKKSIKAEPKPFFTASHIRDDVADATAIQALKDRQRAAGKNTIYKKDDFTTACNSVKGNYWVKQDDPSNVEVDVKTVPTKNAEWKGAGDIANASTADFDDVTNYEAGAQFNDSNVLGNLTAGGTIKIFHR
jgi:hypothetical protein